MLLIAEKGIRRGKCQSIYWYAKANNKYMKDYVYIVISLILGCKLFIWLGNVTKASSKQLWVDQR